MVLYPPAISVKLFNDSTASQIPAPILLCINTTFSIVGNISEITIPSASAVKSTDVFDAYLGATQCADAATCRAFSVHINSTLLFKPPKTKCIQAINRKNFNDMYGGKTRSHSLIWPDSTRMGSVKIWMAPVDVPEDKWDLVYPVGNSCHNGPLPKKMKVYNDKNIDDFCLTGKFSHVNDDDRGRKIIG
ncbi:hypothetical protein [Turkeypox virus]|uniref:Uncharacterized protein n=1 Tax=Turkeypox virus TaxID=336486 RepID=A0A0M3ZK67_9POXV|nr:hypothetical protein ASN15_gp170 [Turkeypox virus]ALA62544.1 hypothetical protein [Turkeypox virus]